MRLVRRGRSVVLWPPAKLNLFLEVLRRRSDGYHDLSTVMTTISWRDRLEIRPRRDGIRLAVEGIALPAGDPTNTAWRAAEALRRSARLRSGVEMRLTKRIPAGSGLGGASADAAAVLVGMNELFRLGATREELAALAARVGSDVPFFLWGGLALCEGRGEKVTPLAARLPGRFVVVCPPAPNATAAVYARLRPPARPRRVEPFLAALADGRLRPFNRLGAVAERLNPQTRAWRRRLGPAACVTGSGSALFAPEDAARRLPRDLGGAVARVVQGVGPGG